jgi:hypothetical protein
MKTRLSKRFLIGCISLAFLTSCAAPETPIPDPTSCEEVEGVCLELSWDGENCTYAGLDDFKSGPIKFFYFNESEASAYVNMQRHTGDKTIQDMIDYIGEEPDRKPIPGWATDVPGIFTNVSSGEIFSWNGVLEPGIHTMICATVMPLGVYYGDGFTVEN